MPKTRVDFWKSKFDTNVARDQSVVEALCWNHIKCLIVWECTIREMRKNADIEHEVTKKTCEFINSPDMLMEL